jgi:hypothetical protein
MATLAVDPTLLTDEPTEDVMVDGQEPPRRKPGRPPRSQFGDWQTWHKEKKSKAARDVTPAWALDPSLLPKRPPGAR